jgi:hypothetical protein
MEGTGVPGENHRLSQITDKPAANFENNKLIEYNPWLNEHKSTAAMNYFLNLKFQNLRVLTHANVQITKCQSLGEYIQVLG